MPDATPSSTAPVPAPTTPAQTRPPDARIDDPAELVRVASMLGRLNTELREIDLDQQTVDRIEALHRDVLEALEQNLGDDLVAELHRFVPALGQQTHSEADVRVAHLLVVGWIEGLFQGMQMTAIGNQLRQQLMREQQERQQSQDQRLPGTYL